jgi:replicative DNA helicase
MTGLEVPADAWAEGAVVGCAVASIRGADLASARIEASDIWDPRLRRIYEAALDLDPSLNEEARICAVMAATGLPESDICRLVDGRPVQWDTAGGFARRVIDAARRRALMGLASDIYNSLGAGARLDEVARLVRELEATGAC